MAVYVDPGMKWPKVPGWPYGYVCHMYADTEEELHELAAKIGLKRGWFQGPPRHADLPHYDLTKNKRHHAVRAGAVEKPSEHMIQTRKGNLIRLAGRKKK